MKEWGAGGGGGREGVGHRREATRRMPAPRKAGQRAASPGGQSARSDAEGPLRLDQIVHFISTDSISGKEEVQKASFRVRASFFGSVVNENAS